jgi:hypothetical protein
VLSEATSGRLLYANPMLALGTGSSLSNLGWKLREHRPRLQRRVRACACVQHGTSARRHWSLHLRRANVEVYASNGTKAQRWAHQLRWRRLVRDPLSQLGQGARHRRRLHVGWRERLAVHGQRHQRPEVALQDRQLRHRGQVRAGHGPRHHREHGEWLQRLRPGRVRPGLPVLAPQAFPGRLVPHRGRPGPWRKRPRRVGQRPAGEHPHVEDRLCAARAPRRQRRRRLLHQDPERVRLVHQGARAPRHKLGCQGARQRPHQQRCLVGAGCARAHAQQQLLQQLSPHRGAQARQLHPPEHRQAWHQERRLPRAQLSAGRLRAGQGTQTARLRTTTASCATPARGVCSA